MKKRWALLTVLSMITAFSLLAGCGGDTGNGTPSPSAEGTEQASAEPTGETPAESPSSEPGSDSAKKNSIILAVENEPPSMGSAEHASTSGTMCNLVIFNGLFRIDTDLTPVPDLVDTYEPLNDTQWQMTLKDDIYFHDGTPCTSEDVKASIERAKEFPASVRYTKNITGVDIVDEKTFIVNTIEPSSTLMVDLAQNYCFIIPKALIDSGNDFNANPIGTGPYIYEDWIMGDKILYTINDNYFDEEKPSAEKFEIRFIPEGASRTIALENGEVDLLYDVLPADYERLKNHDDIEILEQMGTTHNSLQLNMEVAPFDNVLVRQAISSAIDREAIVAVASNNLAVPVAAQAPMNFLSSTDEYSSPYDLDRAKELMAQWGGDPSTIPFEIQCSNETKRRAAEIIQSNLGELGINVTITSMDVATYLAMSADGNYEAAIGGFGPANMSAFLNTIFLSTSINSTNRSRLADERIDELIKLGDTTIDLDQSTAYYKECVELLNQQTPLVPLYQDLIIRAYNKDLEGVAITGVGHYRYNLLKWK